MENRPPVPAGSPFAVLGVRPGASDEEIRQAYVAAIREHPAEKEPELFEKLRTAFELLRDPVEKASMELAEIVPTRPLDNLVQGIAEERRFAGIDAWLAVLKGE